MPLRGFLQLYGQMQSVVHRVKQNGFVQKAEESMKNTLKQAKKPGTKHKTTRKK